MCVCVCLLPCCRTDGYIVCEEHEEILRAAWVEDQEIQRQKEKEVGSTGEEWPPSLVPCELWILMTEWILCVLCSKIVS